MQDKKQLDLIISLFSNGKVQEALDQLDPLIKDNPNDAVLFNIKGACYAQIGEPIMAMKQYEKAVQIDPNYSEAHNNLGITLQELGEVDKALVNFEKAFSLKPEKIETANTISTILQEINDPNLSINYYKKIIESSPKLYLVHFNLGIAYQKLNFIDEAINSYKDVLELEPEFTDAYLNLGIIFDETGQLDESLKNLERAIEIDPTNSLAYNNLGITLKKLDRIDDAIESFKKAILISPDHPGTNHNLGMLLVKYHQSHIALSFLKTALEANSNAEPYWVNYINALINSDELDTAKKFIKKANEAGFFGEKFDTLSARLLSPIQVHAKGKFFKARDGHYLDFLTALHQNIFEVYFEIGSRTGASLALSQSPSIAIDPFFQLKHSPIGKKDFCLIFQETSDSFFENTLPKFSHLKCQLAFIDGMHLFEYALRDFINLSKISSEKALFLFHDAIPWSYKMSTRNNKALGRNEAWTGDIWKLVPILMDAGMKDNLHLLTSAPSGLLAILNPEKKLIAELEKNYDKICAKWLDVEFNQDYLLDFYQKNVFIKPELYLRKLEQISFGKRERGITKEWVSQ